MLYALVMLPITVLESVAFVPYQKFTFAHRNRQIPGSTKRAPHAPVVKEIFTMTEKKLNLKEEIRKVLKENGLDVSKKGV